MVRYYKRKTSDSYSHESLLTAITKVKNKEMSTYKAASVFGVPRSTICARVNGTRGTKYEHRGRPTALISALEKNIANVLHVMERCGFGLTKREVIALVGQYVTRNNIITTTFKDNIPGDDWFVKFIRRNKLSLKKPRAVEIARKKAADPFVVQGFYDLLEETISDLDISPRRIYNLDETSFNIDPSKSKIVGVQGYSCTRTTSTPGRENVTVLLAAKACGEKIPPLIIFKGTYLWNTWLYESRENTTYAATRKGWMETSVFESYFENVIIPTLCAKNEPLLIIYDGHSTHLDINVLEKAAAHNITIIKLPSHTSHILQPLDVSTMKSMKDRWERYLVPWQRKNIGKNLPKSEFSRIMTQVWSELDPNILVNGFKKTGIWPVDRNQISQDKYNQLALSRWEKDTTYRNEIKENKEGEKAIEGLNDQTENLNSIESKGSEEKKDYLNAYKEKHEVTNAQTEYDINLENRRHEKKKDKSNVRKEQKESINDQTENETNLENKEGEEWEYKPNTRKKGDEVKNVETDSETKAKNRRDEDKEDEIKCLSKNTNLSYVQRRYNEDGKKNKTLNNGMEKYSDIQKINPKTFVIYMPQKSNKMISTKSTKNVVILGNKKLLTSTDASRPVNLSTIDSEQQTKTKEQTGDNVSFEELVLQTISRGNQNTTIKKKRVGKGAEVITQKEALQRMKKEKEAKRTKLDNKKKKNITTSAIAKKNKKKVNNKENKKPKKKSKKLNKLIYSDTSNSDIEISIHSDSDIFDLKSDNLSPLPDYELNIPGINDIPSPGVPRQLEKILKKEKNQQ